MYLGKKAKQYVNDNEFHRLMNNAIREQIKIGIKHIRSGRISKKWAEAQDQYQKMTGTQSTNKTCCRWSISSYSPANLSTCALIIPPFVTTIL